MTAMPGALAARASSLDPLDVDSLWVDRTLSEVEIEGLSRTRPELVTRELWHRPGRRIDFVRLREDRDHLLDLGLFANVDLSLARDRETNRPRLLVRLSERPTFYALPTIDYDPENKFSYGAVVSESNFRGLGQSLELSGRVGGVRDARLGYGRRWTFGRRCGLGLSLYWARQKKETDLLRETRAGVSVALAPSRGRTRGMSINPGWENARTEPYASSPPGTLPERDDHRWLGLGLYQDTRAYRLRANRGHLMALGAVRHGGPLGGDTDFWRWTGDLLAVIPTGEESGLTLATRLLWSEGTVPRYLRSSLGGPSTLRGYSPGEFGGESRWVGWAEQVVPLLSRRTYDLRRLHRKVDVTVDGSLFVDAGSIWEGSALARGRAKTRFGGGAGLRFLIPLVQLIRLEVSTDGRTVRVDGAGGIRL